jgi:hypothetical protein
MSERYGTKTIRVHFPGRGQRVYLMLTRFDGEDHLLGEDGWRGEYIRTSIVSRSVEHEDVATGDPFKFVRHNEWLQGTPAETLLKDLAMDRIEWGDIKDGRHYSAADVADLTGREPEEVTA